MPQQTIANMGTALLLLSLIPLSLADPQGHSQLKPAQKMNSALLANCRCTVPAAAFLSCQVVPKYTGRFTNNLLKDCLCKADGFIGYAAYCNDCLRTAIAFEDDTEEKNFYNAFRLASRRIGNGCVQFTRSRFESDGDSICGIDDLGRACVHMDKSGDSAWASIDDLDNMGVATKGTFKHKFDKVEQEPWKVELTDPMGDYEGIQKDEGKSAESSTTASTKTTTTSAMTTSTEGSATSTPTEEADEKSEDAAGGDSDASDSENDSGVEAQGATKSAGKVTSSDNSSDAEFVRRRSTIRTLVGVMMIVALFL